MVWAVLALGAIWLAFRRRARSVVGWILRGGVAVLGLVILATAFYSWVNPPTTPYMWAEGRRSGPCRAGLGAAGRDFAPYAPLGPPVAAEDVNFCRHWGLDITRDPRRHRRTGVGAVRRRSASRRSKNVYLWHGRSWFPKGGRGRPGRRWSKASGGKERILEVYLKRGRIRYGACSAWKGGRTALFRCIPPGICPPCRRRGWRRCCPNPRVGRPRSRRDWVRDRDPVDHGRGPRRSTATDGRNAFSKGHAAPRQLKSRAVSRQRRGGDPDTGARAMNRLYQLPLVPVFAEGSPDAWEKKIEVELVGGNAIGNRIPISWWVGANPLGRGMLIWVGSLLRFATPPARCRS